MCKISSTSARLKEILKEKNLRQVDLLRLCQPYCEKYGKKIGKSDVAQYVSGQVEPRQDKLTILAKALNVTEVWLLGYNLPKDKYDLLQLSTENDKTSIDKQIEQRYGASTLKCITLYTKLDDTDKNRTLERMETMLEADKYITKKSESKQAI